MITPSFSLTATERVLPKLALDFTTASLDSRVTLTRALNTATAINSSGNVAVVNANLPRFDYNPTTLACNGLLIEESRINSTRNNTMAGAVAGTPGTLPTYWGSFTALTGLTLSVIGTGTENGIAYLDIRINGTPSAAGAYNINFDSVGGIAGLTGQTWTNSAYRRLVGGSLTGVSGIRFGLAEYTAASAFIKQTFAANYATVTNAALITQKASATIATSGGATTAWLLPFDQIILTGVAVDFTLRFGLPQFEQGAFATSVIQTSSGAITRNADVATMTGTNFSSWFNATEGAFEVTGSSFNGAVTKSLLSVDDGTIQNRMTIRRTSTNAMGSLGIASNVTQWNDGTAANTWVNNTTGSVCLGYKLNNVGFALNGATTITDTVATIPTVSILRIGEEVTGAATTMCGYIRKILYWPQKLTNAEITAFSKG